MGATGRALLFACLGIALGALGACGGTDDVLPEESGPELQVFSDHYRFRGQDYTSERTLHVAFLASGTPPGSVNVRECVDQTRIVSLVELLRRHERHDLRFLFPAIC